MARRKRQSVSFPSATQPVFTAEELDAEIDGGKVEDLNAPAAPAVTSNKDTAAAPRLDTTADLLLEKQKKDVHRKQEAAKIIKEIPQIFTPDQVAWIFDVYVGAICFVFSMLLKCEFKSLYDELQLDQDVKLAWAKPLAKVASKYAPAEWAGMTAEIELIGSVGLWTATAFGRSKQIAEKERAEKEMELRNRRAGIAPRNAENAKAAAAAQTAV